MRNDIYNMTIKEATEHAELHNHKPDWDLWQTDIDDFDVQSEITAIHYDLQNLSNSVRSIVYYHALASYCRRKEQVNDCDFYKAELAKSLDDALKDVEKITKRVRGLRGLRTLDGGQP